MEMLVGAVYISFSDLNHSNFGEFYNNQIETATTIILSRTDAIAQDKLDKAVAMLREHNETATIVTTPWNELTGEQLMAAMAGKSTVAAALEELEQEHHHHHHDHEEHCCCGHDHHEPPETICPKSRRKPAREPD